MRVVSILILGVTMSACSKTITWKEEVLLHDGTTLIVERSQTRSGASEIGQGPPITAHSITFTPAGSKEAIEWKMNESDIQKGQVDLKLLALGIVQGTPYIATMPLGCLVYAALGKPNPPYLFFKYTNAQWHKITLSEFPAEIERPNVVTNLYRDREFLDAAKMTGFVPAASVKEINSFNVDKELATILKNPLVPRANSGSLVDCVYFSGSLKAPTPITPASGHLPN
ncbi:MAG: hypothetical protein CFE43_21245 [Burkholderiales bacterium PBB3]|nr:MAG: hypothetical protein CFE43_21245 [Burkholderiales bacterium PBB3]